LTLTQSGSDARGSMGSARDREDKANAANSVKSVNSVNSVHLPSSVGSTAEGLDSGCLGFSTFGLAADLGCSAWT
jgi:hypothetical protein